MKKLGLEEINHGVYNGKWVAGRGGQAVSVSPHTNEAIGTTTMGNAQDYEDCVAAMQDEKVRWMELPMPARGEIVRDIGEELRDKKDALGSLISLEMGKIKSEGDGEVQEYIDICDMACGMSRTIGGKTLASERPNHSMVEQWNPIGSMGIISAFNFPCAVSGWNTAIGLIAGNTMIWKGSETSSLVTVA
jgi:aldehyde dehydrogenase family 7 protein A1